MYSKRTNRFYVYAYLREDGTPYYIGKGSGWRMHQKHGYLHLPPDRSRRVKLRENLTDEDVNNMNWSEKVQYFKRNPVTVARQIDHIFNKVFGNEYS